MIPVENVSAQTIPRSAKGSHEGTPFLSSLNLAIHALPPFLSDILGSSPGRSTVLDSRTTRESFRLCICSCMISCASPRRTFSNMNTATNPMEANISAIGNTFVCFSKTSCKMSRFRCEIVQFRSQLTPASQSRCKNAVQRKRPPENAFKTEKIRFLLSDTILFRMRRGRPANVTLKSMDTTHADILSASIVSTISFGHK